MDLCVLHNNTRTYIILCANLNLSTRIVIRFVERMARPMEIRDASVAFHEDHSFLLRQEPDVNILEDEACMVQRYRACLYS